MAIELPDQSPQARLGTPLPSTGGVDIPGKARYVEFLAAPGADAEPAYKSVQAGAQARGLTYVIDERALAAQSPHYVEASRTGDPGLWENVHADVARMASEMSQAASQSYLNVVRVTTGAGAAFEGAVSDRAAFEAAGYRLEQFAVVNSVHAGHLHATALRLNQAAAAHSSADPDNSEFQIPKLTTLAEHEALARESANGIQTPGRADSPFVHSSLAASGQDAPFKKVAVPKGAEVQNTDLAAMASDLLERNPRLGALGKFSANRRKVGALAGELVEIVVPTTLPTANGPVSAADRQATKDLLELREKYSGHRDAGSITDGPSRGVGDKIADIAAAVGKAATAKNQRLRKPAASRPDLSGVRTAQNLPQQSQGKAHSA